jgi:Flp pilus assembly protein TadD
MPTRSDLPQATLARRFATGLVLAVALLGCCVTASAGKPREADPKLQPDAGGFQLTEKVRIPADVRGDYDNAVRLVEAKQYDQGIALLLKVTQKAPNAAAAYVDLGIAYSRSGDLDNALATLKHAVELNPRQLVAYNELGIVYRRKGQFAAARESYERALGVFPGFHYARLNLAILCDLYLADLACARDNYAAYQQVVPDDKQVAKWIADLNARTKP